MAAPSHNANIKQIEFRFNHAEFLVHELEHLKPVNAVSNRSCEILSLYYLILSTFVLVINNYSILAIIWNAYTMIMKKKHHVYMFNSKHVCIF